MRRPHLRNPLDERYERAAALQHRIEMLQLELVEAIKEQEVLLGRPLIMVECSALDFMLATLN